MTSKLGPENLITKFPINPKSTLLLLIGAFIGEDWKKFMIMPLNYDFQVFKPMATAQFC